MQTQEKPKQISARIQAALGLGEFSMIELLTVIAMLAVFLAWLIPELIK